MNERNLKRLIQNYNKTRELNLNRGDPWTALMSAILTRAIIDILLGEDLEMALDGLNWLAGPDAILYTEALGIDGDPLLPICLGKNK